MDYTSHAESLSDSWCAVSSRTFEKPGEPFFDRFRSRETVTSIEQTRRLCSRGVPKTRWVFRFPNRCKSLPCPLSLFDCVKLKSSTTVNSCCAWNSSLSLCFHGPGLPQGGSRVE